LTCLKTIATVETYQVSKNSPIDLEELLTGADVGRLLGCSTARAHQLAARDDFPRPLGRVGKALIWRRSDIEQWGRRRALPQPLLTSAGPRFRFSTEPAVPGEIRISNLDGTHEGFAIAWPGAPILVLEADQHDGVIVRTARREGRINRNHKGSWALHDSNQLERPPARASAGTRAQVLRPIA
jgi:predicted DNA-binding transcriptional regulator AlpA